MERGEKSTKKAALRDCLCGTIEELSSIFVFVEEEVFLAGIIGPDVFDGLIRFSFIFYFL
jgi:hypothetical protein